MAYKSKKDFAGRSKWKNPVNRDISRAKNSLFLLKQHEPQKNSSMT